MKENEILHGFRVQCIQPLPELKATLYRLVYEQNGADLIWLERKDDNKTFTIAFKAIPQDDTGVFHILEHSVLSGSRKYPIGRTFRQWPRTLQYHELEVLQRNKQYRWICAKSRYRCAPASSACVNVN